MLCKMYIIVPPSLIAHFDDVKEANFNPSLALIGVQALGLCIIWAVSILLLNEILQSHQCVLIINEILQLSYMRIQFT